MGIPSPRDAGTCYSSLKLSDFVGCLDATDRMPVFSAAVVNVDIVYFNIEIAGEDAVRL